MVPVLAFVVLGCGFFAEKAGQEICGLSRDPFRTIEDLVPGQLNEKHSYKESERSAFLAFL